MTFDLLYTKHDSSIPSALLHEREEWGLKTLDLVNPPRRFWADQNIAQVAVEPGVDSNRVRRLPTPTELLVALPDDDNWPAQSRRSLARLQAHFLLCEDPQRRRDARDVETLAHQVSLVRHVLEHDHLRRVLIADEVGLGKTVEIGLLLKELLEKQPNLRVLYLAPARLVSNVRREMDRLGLPFRQWTTGIGDARLTDPLLLASLNKAVHPSNFELVKQTPPWDVIVVDECHHLSAWEPGGGDPRQAYKLVQGLVERQGIDARVVLLSGTPHQGNMTRFENLLGLLRGTNESPEALGGRVVYRIKDDIRDWNDRPLFPPRCVNEPLVIDLGPEYRGWIRNIFAFYKPPKDGSGSEPKRRAAGWRCAQALQWAVSSPQAGLGYLVRQAVRAGWGLENAALRNAIGALRPYRLGSLDEPVDQLFQRIMREVYRQRQEQDVEDIDDDEGSDAFNVKGLEMLLVEGLDILTRSGDDKWQQVYSNLLLTAGDEKVVLFAQPIETVTALARFLERQTKRPPALIIGGQADWERNREVDAFRSPTGPQFLVSSRAGGEGINLQVARRLVHIDVPWNPMDLEQRVGRVHRFGSHRTILVDTVVVKDSREADAYRIARQKLELIAATLVESDRFEAVFARVMCLLPPEELQSVLIRGAQAPFDREDQDQIAKMVQQGFHAWKNFHEKFGKQQKAIRQQDPGLVSWDDVRHFLTEHAKARPLEGYKSVRFNGRGETGEAIEDLAPVLGLEDGSAFLCGETSGAFVSGPDGQTVRQLGLNISPVAEALRRHAFPRLPTGAALLRWPTGCPLPSAAYEPPFGVLAYLRQTVRTDQQAGWTEIANSLPCYIVLPSQVSVALKAEEKGTLLRGLFQASVRSKVEPVADLVNALRECERRIAQELRRPNDRELQMGIRHAVTPLFAAVVG